MMIFRIAPASRTELMRGNRASNRTSTTLPRTATTTPTFGSSNRVTSGRGRDAAPNHATDARCSGIWGSTRKEQLPSYRTVDRQSLQIFDSTKFHHLLVVNEDHKLCGVVSDRDLLRALSPYIGTNVETARDIGTLNKRVHQIMTRKPITLNPDASIEDAVELFLTSRISCIPVVNQDFRPLGIISWRDILKTLGSSPHCSN
jgi:acetoin utilization protein AcuB